MLDKKRQPKMALRRVIYYDVTVTTSYIMISLPYLRMSLYYEVITLHYDIIML